jgi:hypothetical protein
LARSRTVLLVAVVVVIVIVIGVAYVEYKPGGSSQQTTTPTSTVQTPANLLVVTGQLPSAYCGQLLSSYRNTSLSIDWGNLAPGTEGIQYLCIENTGTTSVALAVTSNLPSSIGRVTSPQGGTHLNGNGIEMIELDLWLSSGVQSGPIPSFTVTIGGKS